MEVATWQRVASSAVKIRFSEQYHRVYNRILKAHIPFLLNPSAPSLLLAEFKHYVEYVPLLSALRNF